MGTRLSNLPDELLFHILSFLPPEDAFSTCLVSKRGKPLWLSVTNLDFDEYRFTRPRPRPGNRFFVRSHSSFIKFISAAILACGPIKTLRLSVICPVSQIWLNAARDRKVQNLDILVNHGQNLPCSIFSIRTLVVLKLSQATFDAFSSVVELPSLKVLHLHFIDFFKTQHFIELLNGCPILENLVAKNNRFYYDDPLFEGKVKSLSKLVRADVSLMMADSIRWFSFYELLRLDKFCDAAIPMFPNLIHMELILGGNLKWESMLALLNHCSQLQTFVLENLCCAANKVWLKTPVVPECFSSQLRTCCLTEFLGTEYEMTFAKFVLQNSTFLRTMKIFTFPYLSHEKILKMRIELESCLRSPMSSAACELLFM